MSQKLPKKPQKRVKRISEDRIKQNLKINDSTSVISTKTSITIITDGKEQVLLKVSPVLVCNLLCHIKEVKRSRAYV